MAIGCSAQENYYYYAEFNAPYVGNSIRSKSQTRDTCMSEHLVQRCNASVSCAAPRLEHGHWMDPEPDTLPTGPTRLRLN
jgi:hypothetical protein